MEKVAKLPVNAITAFQAAWKASFDEELSLEEAETEAMNLLTFHQSIVRSLTIKNKYASTKSTWPRANRDHSLPIL
jgi:hypothetical protein